MSTEDVQCREPRTARYPHERCRRIALAPRVFCSDHETACAMCNRGLGAHVYKGEIHADGSIS